MKIAIIGANGFIGNRLVETLALRGSDGTGFQPVPIVRQPSSLALPARYSLDCRIADALDADSLAAALKDCDAIVHAALGDPAQIERMPAVLIEAATRANISRIVYLSSASVHGQNIAPDTTEETPLHTRHALDYNNAKVRAERALFQHAAKNANRDLRVLALRPGIVYGPRSRWIADTATDLRASTAWLHNSGHAICNTIYVDNLVHAILRALEIETLTTNEAYLVGDTETITWAQFYAPIARALCIDTATIRHLEKLPDFPRTLRQRIDKTIAHPATQKLLPAIPHKLKQSTKKILTALNTTPRPDSWTLPAAPAPNITQELADLQRNQTKIPYAKAARELSYAPPFSFTEGMRRSLAWLYFARPDLFSNAA